MAGALLAGVAVGTEPGPAHAQTDAGSRIQVEVRSGLVTMDVSNASMVDVIRAIGEEAGFTTVVRGSLDFRITRSLVEVPVEDAMRRLAREITLVMIHAPGGSAGQARAIKEVWLYPSTLGEPAPLRVARAPALVDPELLAGLFEDDPQARMRALREIRRAGDASVVAAIARVMSEDVDPSVRGRAADALGHIGGEQAIRSLPAALDDSNQSVRVQSVRALGRIGGVHAAEILGDVLLNNTDQRMRGMAAVLLGGLETELARSYLEAAVGDSDEAMRTTIYQSLRRWK
jgi:hypothetical protein